jgi:hypothetical protein
MNATHQHTCHKGSLLIFISVFIVLFVNVVASSTSDGYEPYNIRISKSTESICVSWTTDQYNASYYRPSVVYGTSEQSLVKKVVGGITKTYHESTGFTHTVVLNNLTMPQMYYYRVGMVNGTLSKKVYRFRASVDSRVIFYGDLGYFRSTETVNAVFNKLQKDERISMVFHVGDISYADDFPGFLFDTIFRRWFAMVEGISSFIPYQVIPGNHDAGCKIPICHDWKQNFAPYNSLFTMPSYFKWKHNMFYSFDHGPLHFTAISTETDYPDAPFPQKFGDQLSWLKQDLQKAVANRKNVPWIIVVGHRPIYSSHTGYSSDGKPIKDALVLQNTIEQILLDFKVDVYMVGHVHSYERHHPIFKNVIKCDKQCTNATNTYHNPIYPVHIVNGGAGCEEGLSPGFTFMHILPSSAKLYYSDYAYGVMETGVHPDNNQLYLNWKLHSSSTDEVVDEMTIYKDKL